MTGPDAKKDAAATRTGAHSAANSEDAHAFVTLMLGDQLCGVPVLCVRDVLADQTIARIPLAPPEVAGNLNLRGRIVTAIDLRERLRLATRPEGVAAMSIVTEQGSELYALLVDQVSEVLTLQRSRMETNPPTLPAIWADNSVGIYRLEQGLMVVLSVDRLLQLDMAAAA